MFIPFFKDYSKLRQLEKLDEEKEIQKLKIDNLNEKPIVKAENGLDSLRHMYDSSSSEESDDETTLLPSILISIFFFNSVVFVKSKRLYFFINFKFLMFVSKP